MNTNLLLAFDEVDITKPLTSFMDKLTYGGMMLAIGMLTVFSVLIVILIALLIFNRVLNGHSSSKPAVPKAEKASPVVTVVSSTPEEEIVAAISAAIAMAESESDGVKFRVVSFRKR